MKNPLLKRIPRELLGDWRKYLVVSLFLILTIGFVSSMYVANESMMTSAEESVSKYKLEDGHFELKKPADDMLLTAIRSGEKAGGSEVPDFVSVPVQVYENFYKNEEEDKNSDGVSDGTVRVYSKTEAVNLACLMEGSFPESADEIAIDRMHADNAGIHTGDMITVGGAVFDALQFDVAMVTEDGFARLGQNIHYTYAWKYEEKPEDEKEEKSLSDDFLKALLTQTAAAENEIKEYLPRYANAAINFATDDMGSDEAMGGVLLDILIVIIAFIFAVTISNTIAKESQTIGTLRASGYSRGELVRHYLSMPVIVTFLAAGIGNILGYTVFKNVVVSMYYNSYSLPTYETIWNPEAFYKTTLIPVALMFVVNLAVIMKMMRHTPLQFLRHDLKKTKRKRAVRLPGWKFLSWFRLRIMFQNIPNYGILSAGIIFIMVMLAMAVGLPDTLAFYKENAGDMMFADYQYVLNTYKDEAGEVLVTGNDEAEPFAMCSLQRKSNVLEEEISVYGIVEESRYVQIADLNLLKENEVYISKPFGDKYGLKAGDVISLDEKYRMVFDLEEEEFDGYLSDSEITDIGEEEIATVITERDITKMCDQLDHFLG